MRFFVRKTSKISSERQTFFILQNSLNFLCYPRRSLSISKSIFLHETRDLILFLSCCLPCEIPMVIPIAYPSSNPKATPIAIYQTNGILWLILSSPFLFFLFNNFNCTLYFARKFITRHMFTIIIDIRSKLPANDTEKFAVSD